MLLARTELKMKPWPAAMSRKRTKLRTMTMPKA
jgi:hypothetical protein